MRTIKLAEQRWYSDSGAALCTLDLFRLPALFFSEKSDFAGDPEKQD